MTSISQHVTPFGAWLSGGLSVPTGLPPAAARSFPVPREAWSEVSLLRPPLMCILIIIIIIVKLIIIASITAVALLLLRWLWHGYIWCVAKWWHRTVFCQKDLEHTSWCSLWSASVNMCRRVVIFALCCVSETLDQCDLLTTGFLCHDVIARPVLRVEVAHSWCGGQLPVHWTSSCGRKTWGGPEAGSATAVQSEHKVLHSIRTVLDKPNGKKLLEDLGIDMRIILKRISKEWGEGYGWIDRVQNGVKWRCLVKNFRVSWKARIFSSSCVSVNKSSRRS